MTKRLLLMLLILSFFSGFSQPVSSFQHFTGSYDFTMIGNTLNDAPNGTGAPCMILTQSSANLNLAVNQTVAAAYLYWSGSGSLQQADLNVELNGTPLTAQRTFSVSQTGGGLPFFGAFADVTNLVSTTGNGTYVFSDFDINSTLAPYCPTGINYGGWAIIIVYEDLTLPNRVVSLYDGFQIVDPTNQNISFTLNGLNVTDVTGAKVGFLVWEGDDNIAVNEELRINNNIVSNPPLNPANNVFNGTNSYTGSNTLYNMDIDYFQIANYVNIGDTSMNFMIRSAQDLVIANAFVVTLSSLFADATIVIDEVTKECNSREIKALYTVSNFAGTNDLIAGVPIAFYANDVLVGTTHTTDIIPVGGSDSGTATLTIPASIPDNFTLSSSVDDDGTGTGTVVEIDEDNNDDQTEVQLIESPLIGTPENLTACDENRSGFVRFDLTVNETFVLLNSNNKISYYEFQENAIQGINAINNLQNYEVKSYSIKTIWVRVDDVETGCFSVTSFKVSAQQKVFSDIARPLMICNSKAEPSIVNLNLIHRLLSQQFQYMDEIDLSYYQTWEDAVYEENVITNISAFKPPYFPYIIYVKAKGNNSLWCDDIIEAQLNECIVPKGISPNGDGLNDGFDLEIFNLVELKIFNRYGIEVYEHGEGYTNQWWGQDKNGKILPAGTYYYVFRTLFDTYTGYVYVIREVR